MNEFLAIWANLAVEFKLIVGSFLGQTVAALEDEEIPMLKAAKHWFNGFVGGVLLMLIFFAVSGFSASQYWWLSVIGGFIGDVSWKIARQMKAWLEKPETFKLFLSGVLKKYLSEKKEDETDS